MRDTITITRQGQATIPAEIRRKLGIGKRGGVLRIRFNDHRQEAVIAKPVDLAELSRRISSYIKPGTKPLIDVDAYYQKHRKIRL